jgi:hypothetical protein
MSLLLRHSQQWLHVNFSHPFSCSADLPLLAAETLLHLHLPTLVWFLYNGGDYKVWRGQIETLHCQCRPSIWYSPPSTREVISCSTLNSQLAGKNGQGYPVWWWIPCCYCLQECLLVWREKNDTDVSWKLLSTEPACSMSVILNKTSLIYLEPNRSDCPSPTSWRTEAAWAADYSFVHMPINHELNRSNS